MINERSKVSLVRVIEAVNRLPDDGPRRSMLEALRECDRETRYYILHDGRIDAVPV